MIIGSIMFLSCYGNKRSKLLFQLLFIIYCLLNFDFRNYFWFSIINILILLFVISLANIKKINKVVSPFTFLFYSILIDIFCYYYFPLMQNISLASYIMQGIIFNLDKIIIQLVLNTLILLINEKVGIFYENKIISE